MKSATIHSLQIKFITIITILLATIQSTMAQTGDWTSYKSSGYESGSGTQADPYIIKTAEQFAFFSSQVTAKKDKNAYVELGADIDLGTHWWVPIGSIDSNNPDVFRGSFDGKGYTISNLTCNWGKYQNSGLFAFLQGGSIRNIKIKNAELTAYSMISSGARRVGVAVGGTRGNPVIENIIIQNSKINLGANFTQSNGWILVGGILGGNYNTPTIANCYVDVDIDMTKFTSYSANGLKQSWFAMVLGATEPNSQPVIKNVYVAGKLKVLQDLNYTSIGNFVGENGAKNSTAVVGDNCFYENVPTTAEGSSLTHANISGEKSNSFKEADFLNIANSYVKNSSDNLVEWKWADFITVSENYTSGSKKTSYVLSNAKTDSKIEWTVDGKVVSSDEGFNGTQITFPINNKTRQGSVTVTTDGQTFTTYFTIKPKTYGEEGLYAAAYAGGRGTKADPYLIENDLQLARLAYEVNHTKATSKNQRVFGGLYFKLSKDIDLSAALWTPIGGTTYQNNPVFAGKFLGNSHTIKNMRICWTDQSGVWSTWGLFAQLYGQSANEASFCSVTDLIVDSACVEKQEGYTPVGNGMNIGVLVGEMNPFTEVGNIIVKNSTITDNEEVYSHNFEWQIGGMIANVSNGNNSNIYRIYNLSADTKIDMLKKTPTTSKRVWMGGVFGGMTVTSSTFPYSIFPTNIFAHGDAIETNDNVSTNMSKGSITASASTTLCPNWYYTNEATGTSVLNYGLKKSLSEWASTFIIDNNAFIQDNTPNDSCIWTYSEAKGFSFGNTVLILDRTNGDIITAKTPGKDGTELYYWYVSQDRKSWKQVLQADDKTPLLKHTLSLPYQKFDLYVYAKLEDQSSSSQIIKVEKLTFNAHLNVDNDGTYNVSVTNNIWDNNDKFTIKYEWEKNNTHVGTDASSYNPGSTTSSDKISCKVTITDKNDSLLYKRTIYKATVVYLCPTETTINGSTYTGKDDKDNKDWGYSPDMPMLTWDGAYSKLEGDASWTENVIVLMGKSDYNTTNTGFNLLGVTATSDNWNSIKKTSPLFRNTTITGSWNNVDYGGTIEVGGDMQGLHLYGDTRFENITFYHHSGSYDIIYCQYNNLEMGKGIQMLNYPASQQGYETVDGSTVTSVQIFGGFLNDSRFYPLTNSQNIKAMEESMPHGKEGFSITLKSGHYSCVCVGGRQTQNGSQNGVMGSPNLPIKCTITVDIDQDYNDKHNEKSSSYDVGVLLAGNHEGAMYADVDIIVRSGKVARVVNGTLGGERSFNYSAPYAPPLNTYMGRANILIDPASSEYAVKGEPQSVTDSRVVVTEVYGGSLGRGFTGTMKVDNPFYGYSTVTINGGTFKILPDENTKAADVLCGVYGAGAGGMTGIGDDTNHTPDTRIAYWNDTKDVMLYGDYNTAKSNLVHYLCYNPDTHTTTEVDPLLTNSKIVINGGVFGEERQKIDGIYAGGSGYMSKGLWTNSSSTPNNYGGNLYSQPGKTVTSLTINGGTFYCDKGVFAGGRGTDYFFAQPHSLKGDRAEYKKLGQTYGNVELTINGGTFQCPVYGGGYGVADSHQYDLSDNSVETLSDMARIYGKSTVNINGGIFYKNIYGGGDMALVDYNSEGVATSVNISDSADIRGSVYGGGNGRPYIKQNTNATSVTISDKGTENPELVGKVIGGTSVSFIGNTQIAPYIYGDIYGGGNLAQVQGDTYVNFYAGNFAGQIFGGGKGNLDSTTKNTSADITGNTYVTLAQDQGGQEEDEEGKRKDQFSINVIWDKLWDEKGQTFYEWNSNTNRTSMEDNERFFKDNVFVNPHNIYGGGNLACNVAGSSNVTVLKGMTPFSLLATQEWKEAYADNNNPHFYVFGGGYGENTTVGSTNVRVNVEGDYGIYDAEVDDNTEQMSNWSRLDFTTGKKKTKSVNTNALQGNMNVFDNSKGIPNFTVLGVMGGGLAGVVTGDTKVSVDGNTFIHRVYGGGFGYPKSTTDNNTGSIGGNTEVCVEGANIYGDVFGGGAGVAPKTADGIHFTQVARVAGTTKVEISDDAKVYGNVYGGGDIANVGVYQETKPDGYYDQAGITSKSELNQEDGSFVKYVADGYKTFVNIVGGDVYGSVYGGGKGLRKAMASKPYEVGRINGNTLVHIANTEANANTNLTTQSSFDDYGMDSKGNTVPYVWNRIYGGCAFGTVDGSTLVHIEGGMLGLNIFGGGYGNLNIKNDLTDESAGTSTDQTTLTQVLGKKDTNDEGTYANILGNTKVQIDGGSWIWNRVADVNGNITTWTGADEGNNKICDDLDEFKQIVNAINNANTLDEITDAKAKAAVAKIKDDKNNQLFFDPSNYMFNKNFNIFGGGNRACFVGTYNTDGTVVDGTGTATVEINHSPLGEIEDNNGNTINLLDYTSIQGLCFYLSSKSKEFPQFSVFGAGYGANTKVATTKVYVRPGAYMQDNGDHLEVAGVKYRYRSQAADMVTYMAHEQSVYEDFRKVSKEDKRRYYGSSDGGNADGTDNDLETFVRYRASRMAWTLGTPNFTLFEIHGGGFSGYVTGNTSVETDNHLICRNVFGAGLGSKPYGDYDEATKYDFGSIGGNAKVFMKAGTVINNVYGGGAGIESERVNGKDFVDFGAKAGKAVDFPDMARVNGKTEVHIYGRPIITPYFKFDRTLVFGSVYGGGDVANVGNNKADGEVLAGDAYMNGGDFTTLVNIRGAKIFSQIFAGGNGRKVSACADYTKLGGVYGNACVVLDRPVMSYPYMNTTTGNSYDPANKLYMIHPSDDVNAGITPHLFDRIYGGCQNGTIYGNTLVAINGGQFGSNIFGGGWGDCDTLMVNNQETVNVTSANVTGNTNVFVNGGEMELTSYWRAAERTWEPADIINGKTYSPQYNHETLKFKINHNIYAGGNTACVVGDTDDSGNLVTGTGNTYLKLTKGLLYDYTKMLSGQDESLKLFESDEWKEVYNKPGSPHFSVFGAGFGENTNILGDTHIDIAMSNHNSFHDHTMDIKEGEEYKHFLSGYSVMDVVGGGYSGKVSGSTHIEGEGGLFCRRVFGGGFYNSVGSTNVSIKAIDTHDVFGGGLMGDILRNTSIIIGQETVSSTSTFDNSDIYVHGSIYGGNDVSGYVNVTLDKNGYFADNGGTGTHINIFGGRIDGNVYGAGNGDYLYALDREGHTNVTVNEHYPLNPNDPDSEKEPLVYTVPMRETMPSYKAASDAAKIVNINSWRPMTNKVNILIKGTAAEDGKRVVIKGDVYGGGNSATVQKVQKQNVKANIQEGSIVVNIGSHVNIGRVFMGCNGDKLFTASEDNDFMNKFQKLNGDVDDYTKELNLADTIDWMNDPSNKGISTLYLATKNEERALVYPHLLDLYFQPVETDIQGTLLWNGSETGDGLEDCTIGTFCCGGNRGNMNVYPLTAADYSDTTPAAERKIGNAFEYTFPEGLTITDKIVGGCNNANYDYKGLVSHEGGYLLGEIHTAYPFIKLNVKNKFQPTESNNAYKGGNVYGGCFKTGTIRGDITIDMKSDMLEGKSKEKLENSNEMIATNADYSALNVYGAGYGMESYVYGNTDIKFGDEVECSEPSTNTTDNTFNATGTSANFVYGGGQQGNVIGKTYVEVFNGHVFKSVTGGSYSGYVWGSTQVKVGYPKYYTVNPGYGGIFNLKRSDQHNKDIDKDKTVATETIKQSVRFISDDVIAQSVYDAIVARYNGETNSYDTVTAEQKPTFFKEVPSAEPTVGWDKVNINIGEAVYGGGYSLAQGSSVMANNTTILKYTADYNLDSGFDSNEEQEILKKNLGGTTAGFGGNTTILIGDRTKGTDNTVDRDHITISRQDMKVANVADGQDLLGYYYKDEHDKYHYIYQAGVYYKGGSVKAGTLPTAMVGDDVYEYDNEGGVFGDGHLSYAQGFRCADITGYGFASSTINTPKIINTFQRMDVVRLTDNCFSLLGARDYATNAMDKTPYSISRVGEIQMIANDVVYDNDTLANHNTVRSRNYMGFANNIHYVGALTSNVSFTDKWHDGEGKLGTYGTAETYMAVKQKYIDDYFSADDTNPNKSIDYIFEKRNDGTAKNMIGIASGYALKVQNAQELINASGATEEKLYYGPIYGVIEMNLIDVREDEGGGYVYADNVHKRTANEDGTTHDVDFLETTGNFVFPYTPTQGRYIVDDCFPVGYATLSDLSNPDEIVEAHYWYVTGFNYHYTAHVTGYTFDSSSILPRQFNSNNQDGIVSLSGLKPSQSVSLESWKMYSAHTTGYECDLEKRNYTEGNEAFGGYSLYVGASNAMTYTKPNDDGAGFAALLNMKENATNKDCNVLNATLPDKLPNGDAKIVFQLEDRVNNTTSDYYNVHLSEPCKATLVLTAPALEDSGDQKKGKVALGKLYTRTANSSGDGFTYTEVNKGQLATDTEYFYKSGETNFYQSLDSKSFYVRNKDNGKYTEVDKSNVVLGDTVVYYCEIDRYYTYTIDLTIDYVQGPDIEGGITVENCALPGERIRVKKDKVVIKADQAFSVNGYYWRIGKRKKVGDEWVFDSETQWSKYTTSKDYDTFNQSDKEGKGLFSGCYYDKTQDYLEIPAYYFMNGYGIQLGVTMNVPGLDDILPVKLHEADQLVVHNYQRMNPHKVGINLHLAEAIMRAKAEAEAAAASGASSTDTPFTEPRIYISDQSDLTSFLQFVDSIGTNSDAPRYGAYAQFVVQNDLTMPSSATTVPADFAGTLHGNGHVINGLNAGCSIFESVSGNVYNLGLSAGKISNKEAANSILQNYHCCYEYAPSNGKATPVVYHLDGTLDTHYTKDDFRYGRVAYDLNEYYLRARYSNTTAADTLALKYVYDYVANGDYQYAYRTDAITGKSTGVVYLRTGKDSDLPNYEHAETRHDKTHAIDKARAQHYVAATADTPASREGDYLPLFNSAGNGTEVMNDFIFWGQSLQSTPADYPTTIESQQLNYMTNRVYRTAAYYGDTRLAAFHYNAYNMGNNHMGTYVHIPSTTAIDFTCQNDEAKAVGLNANGIYYPPVADNAMVFHDFTVKDGITKNFLVYTAANSEDKNNDTEAYDVVSKALGYSETTAETLINGHHIVADGETTPTFSTALFHLVERTPNSLNSEGEQCNNNNLCVPIAFNVSDHAWYTRKPMYYANAATGAWEGICLPFTIHKAEASTNGEVTHFYGTPDDSELAAPATNVHTLHHEYWLRGMVSVDNTTKATAKFLRPGMKGSNLFAPTDSEGEALTATINYRYDNSFFVNTYGDKLYDKDNNPYYNSLHTYVNYTALTSGIPYIVRFPGERYYEFDLSNAFYNNLLNKNLPAQTVTFHAYGADNSMSKGDVTIPVTTEMATTADGFTHHGIFTATTVAEGTVYGMNADGTAFDDASTLSTVMPFRTYMSPVAQAKSRSIIYIGESKTGDEIVPKLGGENSEVSIGDYLRVRPIGQQRVRIESTRAATLNVFTTTGQLYRILDVQPGTATYSGFQPGIYIFGTSKVMVK